MFNIVSFTGRLITKLVFSLAYYSTLFGGVALLVGLALKTNHYRPNVFGLKLTRETVVCICDDEDTEKKGDATNKSSSALAGVLSPPRGHCSKEHSTKDATMLVTGATDGIGKALVLELAATGFARVIIVSRTEEKMQTVVEEATKMATHHDFKCVSVKCDFGTTPAAEYWQALKDIEASTFQEHACTTQGTCRHVCYPLRQVYHCAGISYTGATYLHEMEPSMLKKLFSVNLKAMMTTNRYVVPTIKRHLTSHSVVGTGIDLATLVNGLKPRQYPPIITALGSAAAIASEPMLTGYATVKGCVEGYIKCLNNEHQDIVYSVQTPLLVVSKLSRVRVSSRFIPSARVYVRSILKQQRAARFAYHTICRSSATLSAYFWHAVVLWGGYQLPREIIRGIRLSSQFVMRTRLKVKNGQTTKVALVPGCPNRIPTPAPSDLDKRQWAAECESRYRQEADTLIKKLESLDQRVSCFDGATISDCGSTMTMPVQVAH